MKDQLDMMQHEFMLHVAERRSERLLRRLNEGKSKKEARTFAEAEAR